MIRSNLSRNNSRSLEISSQKRSRTSGKARRPLRSLVFAAFVMALPALAEAGTDRSESALPRSELASSSQYDQDYHLSVRCSAELTESGAGSSSYHHAVLRAPEFSLGDQETADHRRTRSGSLGLFGPVELYVGAKGHEESVECGQDGPVPVEAPHEVLRAMPDLSLLRQEVLRTRIVPQQFPSLELEAVLQPKSFAVAD